jgi:hypothetical protein
MHAEVVWKPVEFTIPVMEVPVFTKDVTGKKVRKRNDRGGFVVDHRIMPKERPRFSGSGVYSSPVTENFEKWIRQAFFKKYPGSYAVFYKGKPKPVDEYFLGCQRFGELKPCTRFRSGANFLDCQVCPYQRRNLGIDAMVYLRDDRAIDLDNILKVILDSLNKVCFYDDHLFIHKHIDVVTYAKDERIEVSMTVLSTIFASDSLIAGYKIKRLSVHESLAYIKYLKTIMNTESGIFLAYLSRCDKRAYIQNRTIKDLK